MTMMPKPKRDIHMARLFTKKVMVIELALLLSSRVVVASERAGSNACAAFHPETYVRGTLAPAAGLEVVDFVPEGATGNPRQDTYLLRKPGPSP